MIQCFPGCSVVKNLPAKAADMGSIPEWGRDGDPLQYFCLENPLREESGGLESMGSQKSQT